MRILLTGSSGWLGRHLAPALRRAGHAVTGLDAVAGPDTDAVGSVAERAAIDRLFRDGGFDGVIHGAALHKPDIDRHPRRSFVDVNVAGTLALLEAAASHGARRFVFTSTTSLMITREIRDETSDAAVWLDEDSGPLRPRNIYGVTKLAAEELCRLMAGEGGLDVTVLRTARFFPEEDDTDHALSGENMKANEFLNRRLTVEDCAEAHLAALERPPGSGFSRYVVSAPTPFRRSDAERLARDAAALIAERFPEAPALYAPRGWSLPATLGRVYDASRIERELGFRCRTDFAAVLASLREGAPLPFAHDPRYVSPQEAARRNGP